MRSTRSYTAVEVHAEGEQGTCYLGSVFEVPGASMRDKLRYLNEVDDSIRKFLCFEPRGRPQSSANLVFPSLDPRADAGFIICQADRAHAMSGSNTICVVTALLETGTVPMVEPETSVVLETAAGLIHVTAHCRDGRCERVTFDGVPSFVEALDVPLYVPGLGNITVDVAYGGCYYVMVDPAQFGVKLDRGSARQVVEAGTAISLAARQSITVQHPEIPEIDFISYVMLIGDDDPSNGSLRGATVLSGRVDRSPCGTGNSARLAIMAARGVAGVGSRFVARSLIDSEFIVELIGETTVGGRPAVLPRISGRGWVVGTRTSSVDPTDPYPLGYVLSDVWGDEVGGA
ncbi:MAG TPA: proline racemase family protein [Ilumatobacteraceae bacterium]|nr:proline racemase family protein [Ilumatobacteraceae bacterium]